MSSGCFPLPSSGEDGGRLLAAADLVRAVVSSLGEGVHSGDSGGGQYDNTANDGGSLSRLQLAEDLIRAEVRIMRSGS